MLTMCVALGTVLLLLQPGVFVPASWPSLETTLYLSGDVLYLSGDESLPLWRRLSTSLETTISLETTRRLSTSPETTVSLETTLYLSGDD